MDFLIENGVIETRPVGRRTDIRLTALGEELAESLYRMEESVYGDVKEPTVFPNQLKMDTSIEGDEQSFRKGIRQIRMDDKG